MDIAVQDHELVVTVTSEDGKSKHESSIIIRVAEFTGKTDDNGDVDDDEPDRNPMAGFFLDFWWLLLLLIIIIVTVGIIGATMKARKQEGQSEEIAQKEEYDKLYGHQPGGEERPPPPPPPPRY